MDQDEVKRDRLNKQAHNDKIMNAVEAKLTGGDGENLTGRSNDSDETLPMVFKPAEVQKRPKNTLLYDDDIDVEVCRQKSRMLRRQKEMVDREQSVQPIRPYGNPVKYVDSHADLLDNKAQLKSLVSKRHGRLDFDFNDFRSSLIGTVNKHDYSRVQEMQSIIGGIISREELNESGATLGRATQFSPIKAQVNGSISASQLKLYSQLVSKTIRMKQNNHQLARPGKAAKSQAGRLAELLDRTSLREKLMEKKAAFEMTKLDPTVLSSTHTRSMLLPPIEQASRSQLDW